MVKWTSVLAFVVACCVGVTAFCADAPGKKDRKPRDPKETFKMLAGEGKDVLTQKAFEDSRLGKMLGAKAKDAWKDLAGDKTELKEEAFIEAVKKNPDWLRKHMPQRTPGKRGGGGKPGGN